MVSTETVMDESISHYNPWENPELLARADGDDGYMARLAAADLARRRMEANPKDPEALVAKQMMDDELISFEYETGRRLPPAETD